MQNPATDNGSGGEKISKTEEPLAADEEEFAEMDQSTFVNTIDLSIVSVITQTQSLFEMFDEIPEDQIFTADELDQIAIKVDLIKDLIYEAEEQMEVYYFLYGKDQNEFISFLYQVEEDLNAELFTMISLSDLIQNSEISPEEVSSSLLNAVKGMNNQFENLKMKQDKFLATFEISASQEEG